MPLKPESFVIAARSAIPAMTNDICNMNNGKRKMITSQYFPSALSPSAKSSPGFEARQSYPSFSFVAKTEQFGMEQLSQNLQRFDQARSRAIEILIAVGDKDAILFYRFQLPPFR